MPAKHWIAVVLGAEPSSQNMPTAQTTMLPFELVEPAAHVNPRGQGKQSFTLCTSVLSLYVPAGHGLAVAEEEPAGQK